MSSDLIIGIDPGPVSGAYVVFDGSRVVQAAQCSMDEIRYQLAGGILPQSLVAVEHLQCFGMAVGAEVFETAYWVGRLREIVETDRRRSFIRVHRSEVKMLLCQSMRAKDANIRQALIDRYGVVGTRKNPGPLHGVAGHCWSALAVAVVGLAHVKATKAGVRI